MTAITSGPILYGYLFLDLTICLESCEILLIALLFSLFLVSEMDGSPVRGLDPEGGGQFLWLGRTELLRSANHGGRNSFCAASVKPKNTVALLS